MGHRSNMAVNPLRERMADEGITEEAKHFIRTTINSVDQMEVLLFMMSNAEREWSAAEVGARTRLSMEVVAEKLRELAKASLLSVLPGEPTAYRYAPSSSALAAEVAENLNQAYRERRDTLFQLIYSRPLDNIRIFSDAFKIKRKED